MAPHPSRPPARSHPGFRPVALCVPAVLSVLLLFSGCTQEKARTDKAQKPGTAGADTAAYRSAVALTDTTAAVTALEQFLKDYPSSGLRQRVYARAVDLMSAKDPARGAAFMEEHLKTEKDPASLGVLYADLYQYDAEHRPDHVGSTIEGLLRDPVAGSDGYNMVAWDLATKGERLDDAVRLAGIGAERAPDSSSKASVLDTQGWAYYMKGDYPSAVTALEKAVGLQSDEDIQRHLSSAYEKAGRPKDALAIDTGLLVSQEDPELRARVETLAQQTGQSPKEIFARIDQQRKANAKPAPDFALNDYDGKPVRLSDFKGKVVLLNFWHPT